MLAALAAGLRDGGKFDVLPVPLGDAASAQAAATGADALALFYGAPDKPLPAALQALAPKVRERGGRVVAVLQREQAAQRDECFRAGASDLLFMPMPKDQFLARLVASVGLSWSPEAGTPAPVSVSTRTTTAQMEYAAISAAGIEAPGELPVKSGETVRLSWGTFQSWGLVVRGGPSVQIRFAGLAPDEEANIREWLKNGGRPMTPPPPAPTPAKPAAASAVPAAGPPPGFAERKPVKPQTPMAQTRPPQAPARIAPPVMNRGNGAPAAKPAAPPAPAVKPPAPMPPPAKPPAPPKAEQKQVLPGLFDEAAPAGAESAAPSGPSWPVPAELTEIRSAALEFLHGKTVPAGLPPTLAASVKKIASTLSSGERSALENAGPESHLADALAARISLDAATAEGVFLYGSKGMPTIDAAGVAALTQLADAAAARLQQEANTAIGKGQVEQLQMVTAASAALSRDLLTFKETADRLRGVGAAPRLSAGGLDPDVVLPGQQPRPRMTTQPGAPVVKAELRDFQGLEAKSSGGKTVFFVVILALFIASLSYAFFFALPRSSEITAEAAGPNVVRIEVSGPQAMVTVKQAWADNPEVGKLVNLLRSNQIQSALVRLPSGANVGIIDVRSGKLVGRPSGSPAPAK
jgi:hypothetical protein